MNVVVIGDISWQYLYHLGDEAMTEAAIDMLQSRDIAGITLVAGEPSVAEEFYGLPAVRRIRFKAEWSRARNEWRLADVARVLAEQDWSDHPIYPAIRDADAVLIAGGGNMNTRDYHLLFERVAAKRIAEHFGTPLYVTSQTVGPMLEPDDLALIVEIADYAQAFGCREGTTAALMREHVARPEYIHHTLDDAAVLAADSPALEAVDQLAYDGPFVVASFTHHHGSVWADQESYYQDIAAACRAIAVDNEVSVLLAPHAGSLDSAQTSRDQDGNAAIAAIASHERVRALRMITAREDVALIQRAVLSLSTRYHPTVFGPAVGTPTIGIASSYYTSVRMRGSMGNVGLEKFVLPTNSMHLLPDAAAEAIGKDATLTTFLEGTRDRIQDFQHAWWDALASAMHSGSNVDFDRRLDSIKYEPRGAWSVTNESIFPIFDKYAQAIDLSQKLTVDLVKERHENERLAKALESSRGVMSLYRGSTLASGVRWIAKKLKRRSRTGPEHSTRVDPSATS